MQPAGGRVHLEGGNVAAGGDSGAERLAATSIRIRRARRNRCAVSQRNRRVVVKHVNVVARSIGYQAERVDSLAVEGLLRSQDAVAAHRELGDVGAAAGIGRGAVAVALFVCAAVQNIKEAAAGDQDRAHRVGPAGTNR